jgi:DNA-binding NtrC family response regulator
MTEDRNRLGFHGIIGDSEAMVRVYSQIDRIAPLDIPVLVVGETGTGKDLIARAIHQLSGRRDGPFVPVNTGALPPQLVSSELFGHERGAFTGAVQAQRGYFEIADRGTLFLDEVSTMDLRTQVSLLRVLETKEIQRVGGDRALHTNTRIVSATNENLPEAVKEKRFRVDLYHRLNVFAICVPPLRLRDGDVARLARHFVSHYAREYNLEPPKLSASALALLDAYTWPGNVRELESVVMRLVITMPGRHVLPEDLPDVMQNIAVRVTIRVGSTIQDLEVQMIMNTLREVGGNKMRAAESLGISRKAMYEKMKRYQIPS